MILLCPLLPHLFQWQLPHKTFRLSPGLSSGQFFFLTDSIPFSLIILKIFPFTASHILLWNVCPKSLLFWVALMNQTPAWNRCIHLIVRFHGSFKRLYNLSILPLGLEFYAPLTGVLPSSDGFILSCWLINTWPVGTDVQKMYSLTDLFSSPCWYLCRSMQRTLDW